MSDRELPHGNRRLVQGSSCSFEKATFEPQNEIEPMIAASTIGISASSVDVAAAARNSTSEISATAPPPTPLNSATICGIAVIFTLRAAGTPISRADHDADDDQAPSRRSAASSSVPISAIDHADRGDQVAADRRARAADHAQADDEQREPDDVEEVDASRAGSSLRFFVGSRSGRACGP